MKMPHMFGWLVKMSMISPQRSSDAIKRNMGKKKDLTLIIYVIEIYLHIDIGPVHSMNA